MSKESSKVNSLLLFAKMKIQTNLPIMRMHEKDRDLNEVMTNAHVEIDLPDHRLTNFTYESCEVYHEL